MTRAALKRVWMSTFAVALAAAPALAQFDFGVRPAVPQRPQSQMGGGGAIAGIVVFAIGGALLFCEQKISKLHDRKDWLIERPGNDGVVFSVAQRHRDPLAIMAKLCIWVVVCILGAVGSLLFLDSFEILAGVGGIIGGLGALVTGVFTVAACLKLIPTWLLRKSKAEFEVGPKWIRLTVKNASRYADSYERAEVAQLYMSNPYRLGGPATHQPAAYSGRSLSFVPRCCVRPRSAGEGGRIDAAKVDVMLMHRGRNRINARVVWLRHDERTSIDQADGKEAG